MARRSAPVGKPKRALGLVRISDDRDGVGVGVGRQEDDCRALAARLGWEIAEVVVENDTSAYQTRAGLDADGLPVRSTRRPEFRRVLRMLHDGVADGLIVYDIDRLARQPRDLEALIDLAEASSIPVTAVTGSVDVSTSAGRAMSRVMVAIANKSSEDTSRRVSRAARQSAELGRPKVGGFRPYGYEPGLTAIREDEAAVVREVAERILLGDTLTAIARDLNARGVPTVAASEWRPPSLRSIVSKPTVAGLRGYRGEVVATGDWPPILDRGTWETVRAVLADRKRGPGHSATRHLLSGIATCGVCGTPLRANTARHGGHPIYRCQECHGISRRQEPIDEYVTGYVQRLLEQDPVQAARRRQAAGKPGRALSALTSMKERRKQLLRDFAVTVDADDLAEMLAAVDAQIAALEAEASQAGGGIVLPKATQFRALPLERKRAVIRALVSVKVRPVREAGKGLGVDVTPQI